MRKRRSRPSRKGHLFQRVRLRLPAALALVVAAYFAITASLAEVAAKADPALAHALAPNNGVITASLAEQQFAAQPSAEPGSRAAQLATEALLQDATAVEALTVLGFQAQLRGEEALSDGIFSLGLTLSRRELRPQLWAIEEAVIQGDISSALRRYDLAMRTSTDAQAMLFPILASALAEPRIRADLLQILQEQPIWTDGFIAHAAVHGSNPQAVARFFSEASGSPLPITETHRTDLVTKLVADGAIKQAWNYYKTYRPGADRRTSRDPAFQLASDSRAPFDWMPGTDPALSAAILQTSEGGLVDFAAPASTGGVLLTQMQLLPPGSYRLAGRSSAIEQPVRTLPYWLLSCDDGRELGRVIVPNSAENNGAFAGTFTVPDDCPVQTLALVARPSEAIGGLSGQILEARLSAAR